MLNGKRAIIIICILAVVLSAGLSGCYFRFSYFEPDTVSYLFQAKLFAHGRLSMPPPPEYGFSSSPHINIHNGKWSSKYPFGNALMLTLGVLLRAPWLIPALLTGLALLLLYLIVRQVYGHRIALLASLLALISPATLGMGSTWFSEPVSRFYLAIYLLALIRALKGGGWFRYASYSTQGFYPAISGLALGYAFNTRPIPAVAFGLAGAGLTLYWLARSKEKKALLKTMAVFLIPFAMMMLLCLAWNTHFTGNPLKFTHNVAQPYDKMGFGKRTEGYEPDLENAFTFTPKWAFERLWRHTLPCISFNTLGWGYYRPNLLRWEDKQLLPLLRAIPLIFPLILMLIPIVSKDRNRYDVLFLSFLLLNLLFYFFFYFEGSTWGITPVNARYYTECTLLGIIPLVARGMFILYGLIRRLSSKLPMVLLGLVLVLLSLNTVHSYVLIGKPYQNWGDVYQKLPRLVKQQEIHQAVIFVPNHRGAPIGDYPFQSLEEADIIYFKLGPSKVWKLTNSNWRKVYDQYFTGRRAYRYENGGLLPLRETDITP
jgi:hypothetical protein